ncbi:hypothetical protein CcrColossus_gp060 [Caulobacter phage CcrColossus]|uniref:Uncharacterized protein n=1 Tax=Caulobacter phage CcrColossus TaxID=1211640 RepID=K4JUC6_9CAUD|nr:hypothetical protein CcrColossus_gp060 [Caulobacter phage CcrColossus]AFU87930.1 hypothetical protein CcrColossus_gp060 [Caulobacter phage CcrColossus]
MNEDLLLYSLYGATIMLIAVLRFEMWKWWKRGARLTEDQVDSVLCN